MTTVTTQLPYEIASALSAAALSEGRSKSWMIREAVADFLSARDKYQRLTAEGLESLRAGRVVDHAEILADLQRWGGHAQTVLD